MLDPKIPKRKDHHIEINLKEDVQSYQTNGFEDFSFVHEALPEIDLADVDITLGFLERKLKNPLLISSMTGGSTRGGEINKRLAAAAQKHGLSIGVGSQRAAINDKSLVGTFDIRKAAPDVCIFANIGAVQINYGYHLDQLQRVVDMIDADALILHLNPLQEAIQPEGDTNFSGLLRKIEMVCKHFEKPVIVKEVGWGISAKTAKKLIDAGVSVIDIAGAGGTSWSQVERYRLTEEADVPVAEAFRDWGIPTAQALIDLRKAYPGYPIIASGGIKNGMDAAKALALGADIVGMAGVILKAAVESETALDTLIHNTLRIIKIAMFATGSKTLFEFRSGRIKKLKG